MKQLVPHQGPEGLHGPGSKDREAVSGEAEGPGPEELHRGGAVWAGGWGYRRTRGIRYLEAKEVRHTFWISPISELLGLKEKKFPGRESRGGEGWLAAEVAPESP